jgi:hypothetical protein
MATSQSMGFEQSEEALSKHQSLAQARIDAVEAVVIDVSDDKESEVQLELNEHELRELQKINSIKCIELMRISPKEASHFDIPLCRMVPMPLVQLTLGSDIKWLEAEFFHNYSPGANVFYVSLYDENGEERSMTDEDQQKWGPHWTEEFEARLAANPYLSKLSGRLFFICDSNHQF